MILICTAYLNLFRALNTPLLHQNRGKLIFLRGTYLHYFEDVRKGINKNVNDR